MIKILVISNASQRLVSKRPVSLSPPSTISLPHVFLQLFRERLSNKVHSTTPKGIVGGFEFTVFQRNKSRFDSYSVRNCVLTILHITFWDCRVHIFSDNLSRNSCIQSNLDVANVKTNDILYSSFSGKNLDNEISL